MCDHMLPQYAQTRCAGTGAPQVKTATNKYERSAGSTHSRVRVQPRAVSAIAEMTGSVHSINGSCDMSTGYPLREPISGVRSQPRLDVVGLVLRSHLFPSYNLGATAALSSERVLLLFISTLYIHTFGLLHTPHTHTRTHTLYIEQRRKTNGFH